MENKPSVKDRVERLKVDGTPIKVKSKLDRINAHNAAGRVGFTIRTWLDRMNGGYWVQRLK